MTQQEKAREVLDGLLRQGHYNRCGVSEKFLRKYAAGKWVDKDVRLDPDALVDEAEARVSAGKMICFFKGHNRTLIYKPAKGQKKNSRDQLWRAAPDCSKPPNPQGA